VRELVEERRSQAGGLEYSEGAAILVEAEVMVEAKDVLQSDDVAFWAGQTIHAVWDETSIVFADANGEVLIEQGWPAKGTTYVSNGIRRGRPSK
jgi:hypothetical protein